MVGQIETFRMRPDTNTEERAKAGRKRARGQWAVVIGMIGLAGCIVGAIQYWLYGSVSIRPGHAPVAGNDAVTMLLFLFFVSTGFIGYGYVAMRRVR